MKAAEVVLRDYFAESFRERRKNFDEMFQRLDSALEQGNEKLQPLCRPGHRNRPARPRPSRGWWPRQGGDQPDERADPQRLRPAVRVDELVIVEAVAVVPAEDVKQSETRLVRWSV